MSFGYRISTLLVTALLALGGATAARAQTFIPLQNTTTSASFAGLFVQITNCTYELNGVVGVGCANDGLELEQVSDGRGKVELEIVPTTNGSPIFSSATGSLTAVDYTLTVTTNEPSTASITSYALNTTGTNTSGTQNNFFNTATGNPELVASILSNAAAASCSPSGGANTESCTQTLVTPVSSLSISGGLAISGATNTGFKLTSASFVFTTAPEPASLSVLTAGIGGLAALRRRRKKARTRTSGEA